MGRLSILSRGRLGPLGLLEALELRVLPALLVPMALRALPAVSELLVPLALQAQWVRQAPLGLMVPGRQARPGPLALLEEARMC